MTSKPDIWSEISLFDDKDTDCFDEEDLEEFYAYNKLTANLHRGSCDSSTPLLKLRVAKTVEKAEKAPRRRTVHFADDSKSANEDEPQESLCNVALLRKLRLDSLPDGCFVKFYHNHGTFVGRPAKNKKPPPVKRQNLKLIKVKEAEKRKQQEEERKAKEELDARNRHYLTYKLLEKVQMQMGVSNPEKTVVITETETPCTMVKIVQGKPKSKLKKSDELGGDALENANWYLDASYY